MKILGKPKNYWGWFRVTGFIIVAGVAAWMIAASVLQSMHDVSWLLWSRYKTFSLMSAFELAILPLLGGILAGWLEDQDEQTKIDQYNQKETERTLIAQRKEIMLRFHEEVLAILAEVNHNAAEIPAQARLRISESIQAHLPELDGKGKGEMLHFLFEKGLLSKENPIIELRGMDFGKAILSGFSLGGISLEQVNLSHAKMDGAQLLECQLSGANLKRAFLRNADLRSAGLLGSNLSATQLEDANLEGADLRDTNLKGAFLMKANLKNCLLSTPPVKEPQSPKREIEACLEILDQAILVDTILPDGRKGTNERGNEYLRKKEMDILINRL
jgi:hypothetical protein